jgi:hypothetical protein
MTIPTPNSHADDDGDVISISSDLVEDVEDNIRATRHQNSRSNRSSNNNSNNDENRGGDDDNDYTGPTNKKVYAVSLRWEAEQKQRRRQKQPRQPAAAGPITEQRRKHRRCKSDNTNSNGVNDATSPMSIIEIFNTIFCCCARRVGSMFFLLESNDGSPIIVAGPCWPFCTFITTPLILGISALVGYYMIYDTDLPWWVGVIYFTIMLFVLIVLFCTSCRDPGLLERVTDDEAATNGWLWNEQVGSYRPPGAMYCRECKALVYDYDHVCPWTGTAIGKGNMRQFKVFVLSVNILCYFSVGLVLWRVFWAISD